jgi:hypothetical protein
MDPKMLVNETTKTFGEYEEQVFNLNTERRFGANYAYRLDFSQKENPDLMLDNEKKALKLKPRPYNPTTEYGTRIIERAMDLPTETVHIVSKTGGTPERGLLKASIYKRTAPTTGYNLITTFVGASGSPVKINPSEFFDNIISVSEFQKMRFGDILNHLHDKKIKAIANKDKRGVEEILKNEIEKLNRWAYEEKNSLKYQIKALENKLIATKKRFKDEKALAAKIKIGAEIEQIQKKIADLQINTFEKQCDVDKKATSLIAGRKRALKHTAEVIDLMTCSFEII